MHQPIRQPAAGVQRTTPQATPSPRGSYVQALLRIFAELACRLR